MVQRPQDILAGAAHGQEPAALRAVGQGADGKDRVLRRPGRGLLQDRDTSRSAAQSKELKGLCHEMNNFFKDLL